MRIEREKCAPLAGALRARLTAADRAEAEAWETVEGIAESLELAASGNAGLGIAAVRSAPIAQAMRELLAVADQAS